MPDWNEIEKTIENVVLSEKKKENMSIFEKILGEIGKATPAKQMMIGVSVGWVSGFLAMRIGKTTAMAVGGGIILLQIANEKGFIKINWDKVNQNIDKVEDLVNRDQSTWMNKITKFAARNSTFTSGYLGGFLIGLGSH
ncbi:FUN14 domain-containing protein 1-like [Harmonia axyridis]|uniref:FUN14 domain-containing protein 1-like n=1 Tax=Harmonia axyridis TaxID=115357 RepID=UPI001E2773E6|nr:FUN14 domain-containing protein 1-like [Harmonia axyridis]